MPIVDGLKRIAEKKGATPAQVALAWLLSWAGCAADIAVGRGEPAIRRLKAPVLRLKSVDNFGINPRLFLGVEQVYFCRQFPVLRNSMGE